jgi:hypothetical protein
MNDIKRAQLRVITLTRLAQASDTSLPYLSKVVSGKHKASRAKAELLARCANQLSTKKIFDPNDFNDELNPNLKHVCDDVVFLLKNISCHCAEVLTALEISKRFNDIDLIVCLSNLVDGERYQTWGPYLIELHDEESTGW